MNKTNSLLFWLALKAQRAAVSPFLFSSISWSYSMLSLPPYFKCQRPTRKKKKKPRLTITIHAILEPSDFFETVKRKLQ
jgi:hypothetical protein